MDASYTHHLLSYIFTLSKRASPIKMGKPFYFQYFFLFRDDFRLSSFRFFQHRTGLKHILVEGHMVMILHKQRLLQTLQKGFFTDICSRVMDKYTWLHITVGASEADPYWRSFQRAYNGKTRKGSPLYLPASEVTASIFFWYSMRIL